MDGWAIVSVNDTGTMASDFSQTGVGSGEEMLAAASSRGFSKTASVRSRSKTRIANTATRAATIRFGVRG
jgi:hypothetical protein